ncbi:MAG: hypothetical protein U9O64_02915 [Campylobacterota bacterium]|nr:hypothetical protein [Campylobacterota bacterium]
MKMVLWSINRMLSCNGTVQNLTAITIGNIASGIDTVIGVDAKYHVWSIFYLLAKAQGRFLGKDAQNSQYIEDTIEGELYLGFGFFNDKDKPKEENLDISPYLRIAHD